MLHAFADQLDLVDGARLLLTGPAIAGVDDDPEGGLVLAECRDAWERLPPKVRAHVHLACVPMVDPAAAATIANAIQRYATIVTQKSLAEGFGLTVVEAMWKRRPVVASRIGGIVDQVDDGTSGVLVDPPTDLDQFGAVLARLLGDDSMMLGLGTAAYERAHRDFLGDRHLERYGRLFAELLRD